MNPSRTRDYTPLYLIGAMCLMWVLLHTVLGTSFFGPTPYNTYTRQALAWRQGLLHLPEDVPHLELAIFEGEYYVSFPPVPSLVLWPLTFLFGENTPDDLLKTRVTFLEEALIRCRKYGMIPFISWPGYDGIDFILIVSVPIG